MSRRFDNAVEATVEQQEKGRVFLSSFGEEKENDFINGEFFGGYLECIYFFVKGKNFVLTQEGRRKRYMFNSYVEKHQMLEVNADSDENNDFWFTITSVDVNHPIYQNNKEIIIQAIREIEAGNRQLVYCSPERPKSKVNTTDMSELLGALA